ncbi:hypothetical protein OSB04_027068 [Centaurea solstitialis]|uniref:Uncharacterized protein n=1 Tax=Centaurea solstitialis TaxID=347529 RepID=A0AA38VWA4_9ASTR|nr:hypothetical protein OSB04_027068 [Centaurea solstitialis]
MELPVGSDSTRLSYWLTSEFLLCLLSVLTSVTIASYLIWKYEGKDNTERAHNGEEWLPCWKGLSPVWLLAFRIIAFCLLLAVVIADVVTHGNNLFYYYTQWTLMLTTIYFLFGSLLSACGCFWKVKIYNARSIDIEAEQGIHASLIHAGKERAVSQHGESYFLQKAPFWGHVFQIVYQMTAGAVMLTDGVYWIAIFPFLTLVEYEMGFLTVVVHSLNLVLLLGDTAINRLVALPSLICFTNVFPFPYIGTLKMISYSLFQRFPWYRIAYFILFTALYVIFEWIVHACTVTWWPYPFLNVSEHNAALWYWVVAILHLPCYALFWLLVKVKYLILSRWFPESYACLR